MKKTSIFILLYLRTGLAFVSPDLQKADTLYRSREVAENAGSAMGIYQKACELTPTVHACWRYSMASHFVGMRYTEEGKKDLVFKAGKEAGEKAIAMDSTCVPCHFWTAINMALYGQAVGKLKMLFSLKEIEAHLDEVIAREPGYAMAGAYRIKGMIEKNLPGILGGSNERALSYFEKAIQASPTAVLNYLVLAQFLKEEGGQPAKAFQVAQEGLSLPVVDDVLEARESRNELSQFAQNSY